MYRKIFEHSMVQLLFSNILTTLIINTRPCISFFIAISLLTYHLWQEQTNHTQINDKISKLLV